MGAAVEPAQIGSGCQPYMIGRRVSGDRCVTGGGQGIFASSIGVPAATRNATGTARACGAARSPWAIPATANEPGARSAARPGRPSWAAVSMGHLALKRAIRHAEPTTWLAATSRPWSIPQGPGRPPVQVPHLRPGGSGYHRRQDPARHGTAPRPKRRPRAARADVRLYRAKSAVRAPDRGGQGPALAARGPRRRPGRQACSSRRTWPYGDQCAGTARPRPNGPAAPSAST